MDIFPKWIIEDNSLIIGKVIFHRQLAENVNNVKGGGWFEWDYDREAFILYGKSEDFGKASKQAVQDAVSRGHIGRYLKDERYSRYKIYFSSADTIESALNDMEELVPFYYILGLSDEQIDKMALESFEEQITKKTEYLNFENPYSKYSFLLPHATRKEREIASKMQSVRSEAKIGRNEPCPCHSGKKYKKCCLK